MVLGAIFPHHTSCMLWTLRDDEVRRIGSRRVNSFTADIPGRPNVAAAESERGAPMGASANAAIPCSASG
jgi:hypothetical protein